MLNPKCQVSVFLLYILLDYFLNDIIYLMITYKCNLISCYLLIFHFVGGCMIRVMTNDGQVLNMQEKLSTNEEVVMTIVKSSNNGIEVRSKRIGKVGGSKMNNTNDNYLSKSNIINGKVNRNNLCYV